MKIYTKTKLLQNCNTSYSLPKNLHLSGEEVTQISVDVEQCEYAENARR